MFEAKLAYALALTQGSRTLKWRWIEQRQKKEEEGIPNEAETTKLAKLISTLGMSMHDNVWQATKLEPIFLHILE
ncbi:hypothetical protein K1719_044476 [Acacia pycnantha]|nr:hypothetical protein K1719_044476 [Acacia pycnantha]